MSDHAVEEHQQHRLDPTGHCIDHPQIRVRRPNPNGHGWRTVLTNGCPLCSVVPVKSPLPRRTSNRALTRMDSGCSNISVRSRRSQTREDDCSPYYCSASDVTATTVASSNSSGSGHSIIDDTNDAPFSPGSTSSRSSRRVVCGMRYVDPATQKRGSYTGQVSPEQLPNGTGCLRLNDGETLDGEWKMGRLVRREDTQPKSKQQRHPSRGRREMLSESLRSLHFDEDQAQQKPLGRHPSRSKSRPSHLDEDGQSKQKLPARHPSRSRREMLSESFSMPCSHLGRDDQAQQKSFARHPSRSKSFHLNEEGQAQQKTHARHPSRSRRESLARSLHANEPDQHQFTRQPSCSRREALSRSIRFDEEETNSIGGENNSLGSHGENTVGTYSARESKGCRVPKKSAPSGSGGMGDRRRRSYMEVKH